MNRLIYILLLSFILFSCIPEDSPVQPFERGDAVVTQVVMGSNYPKQIYFSLPNNTIVSENIVSEWDLAFPCKDGDLLIKLNPAKEMKVYDLGEVNYDDVTVTDTTGIKTDDWQYDSPSGSTDSIAIGQWWKNESGQILSKNHVYILDRGLFFTGKKEEHYGIAKFQVIGFTDNTFKVRFTAFKNNESGEIEIEKDPTYNYVQLSFDDNGKVLKLQPPKEQWDLLFTKDTDLAYTKDGFPEWYSVTNVIINSNNVVAARIDSTDFESIDMSVIDTLDFSSNRNIIGYDWKTFDIDAGYYTVNDNIVYIIKNVDDFYFKLRFIDFYDDNGAKGTPTFEYKLL